jgi:cell division inhibitor SepF
MNQWSSGYFEVVLFRPGRLEEMERAVYMLQSHATVVLDLSVLAPDQAQRFVDSVAGAVCALDGAVQRVSERVLVAVPMSVRLSTELDPAA